jgi:hypothetical protein
MEGSGGSSGDIRRETAGSGGGIVWMSSTSTIHLYDTNVVADGKDGTIVDNS